MNTQRMHNFLRWWKKEHHNLKAHYWLIKQTKRVIHNYNVAPEQYTHAQNIMKRYNCGEYKRLNKTDAKFLWRTTHPSINERRERLLSTAIFLQEKVEESGRKFSK